MTAIINNGVEFNGRRIVHPGAYSSIDASAMVVTGPNALNIPVLMGESDAGIPGTVQFFNNAIDAHNYCMSGDIDKAIDFSFSPSSKGGQGATQLGIFVTNANTQATLTKSGLIYNSLSYGLNGNSIQAKVEAGTILGSMRLTLSTWANAYPEVYDNVGTVIQVKYTGAALYADIAVTQVDGIPTTITTRTGSAVGTAVADLIINLTTGQYPTLSALCNYINSIGTYSAQVVNSNDGALSTSVLDSTPTTVINVTGGYLLALVGDLLYRVNGTSQLVSIAKGTTPILGLFAWLPLKGGATGIVPTTWSTYFDTLTSVQFDILCLLSSDPVIQAEGSTYVTSVESFKPLTMFTGGALGETSVQIEQRIATINNSRVIIGYPGIIVSDINGNPITLPSIYTGALEAALVAGSDASEAITFDYVDILGLETPLMSGNPTIDNLITNGACVIEQVQAGGFRVVSGITTYLTDDNAINTQISCLRGADELSAKITTDLENTYVGRKGVSLTATSIKNTVAAELDLAISNGDIVNYGQITVTITGTVVTVDYEVAQVEPMDFFLVTSHFIPTSITATTLQ